MLVECKDQVSPAKSVTFSKSGAQRSNFQDFKVRAQLMPAEGREPGETPFGVQALTPAEANRSQAGLGWVGCSRSGGQL